MIDFRASLVSLRAVSSRSPTEYVAPNQQDTEEARWKARGSLGSSLPPPRLGRRSKSVSKKYIGSDFSP